MNLEGRIKHALRAEAGTAEPTSTKWDAVRRSTASFHGRRSQRLVVAGLSVAVLMALIIGIVSGDRRQERRLVDEPTETSRPAFIVTDERERFVVRSATDGGELRVLIEGDEADGLFGPVVSPDGATVYLSRVRPAACEPMVRENGYDGTYASQIVSVPFVGGRVREVARGTAPAVSPDGDVLVYMSPEKPRACGIGQVLVAMDIDSGRIERLVRAMDLGSRDLVPMSFSPDGGRLLVRGQTEHEPPRWFILNLKTKVAREIRLWPNRTYASSSFRADFIGRDEIAMWFEDELFSGAVAVDVDTGKVVRRLFEYEHGAVVTTLDADASGEHLVVAVEAEESGARGLHGLLTWSKEDGIRTLGSYQLGDDAVWAPGP